MRLIADRDADVHGHVDEPSVGVLLSWLINDDNNDDGQCWTLVVESWFN